MACRNLLLLPVIALFVLTACQDEDAGQGPAPGSGATSTISSAAPGQACGGVAAVACGAGEYCNYGVGQCEVADAQGVCEKRPEVCPEVHDPVCGCDGNSYGNACKAAAAGISIHYPGECDD